MSILLRLVLIYALALFGLPHFPAFAQLTEATLKGAVTDSAESVVSGSLVKVRNQETGLVRSTSTDGWESSS